MAMRRVLLDADQIRDAMLSVSGQMQAYAPAASVEGDSLARSIQVKNVRNTPDEFLNSFDGPDMFNSCACRFVTTTPVQSLLVVNSPWTLDRATAMAKRVTRMVGDPHDLVGLSRCAFELAYSRQATKLDVAQGLQFLHEAKTLETTATEPTAVAAGLADLCHVLMCSNEFVYVD